MRREGYVSGGDTTATGGHDVFRQRRWLMQVDTDSVEKHLMNTLARQKPTGFLLDQSRGARGTKTARLQFERNRVRQVHLQANSSLAKRTEMLRLLLRVA